MAPWPVCVLQFCQMDERHGTYRDSSNTDRGRDRRAVMEAHAVRMVGAVQVDPIPVARAKGIYFWTPEGKRFIDFNSQLMCVTSAMATSA